MFLSRVIYGPGFLAVRFLTNGSTMTNSQAVFNQGPALPSSDPGHSGPARPQARYTPSVARLTEMRTNLPKTSEIGELCPFFKKENRTQ